MKALNICVVGGEGYIGTRVSGHLRSQGHLVTVIDLCWFADGARSTVQRDIREYKIIDPNYDVVIWLAGHSSVGMCRSDKDFILTPAYANNVAAFNKYLSELRLEPNKKKPFVIYASSASVYGDTQGKFVTETAVPWTMRMDTWLKQSDNREIYDMTKIRVDNIAYDYYSDTGNMIVGLRFGTVNGPSYNMRTELMLNSMVHDAIEHGEIYYSQPDIFRSILDIDHLCRIVLGMIKANEEERVQCGVYNAATYTHTVYELAQMVSKSLGFEVKVIETESSTPSKYNFKLDCSRLESIFENDTHTFSTEVYGTIGRLKQHYDDNNYTPTNRNDPHD